MIDRARILLVDDEPAIRLFVGEELSQVGYEVLTAASGEEALAQLADQPVDLMLLDLKMGGMNGLQVMAEVERQPLPPVVILLTAHASLDSAIEAMRRGGHDYLIKPCSTEQLLDSVEKGLSRRRETMRQQQLLRLIEDSARQLQATQRPEEAKPEQPARRLEARGLLLDPEQLALTRPGQPVHLTPTEFRLLAYLMEQADRVVAYADLMQVLHGDEADEWEARQALSTHLWRLRKKVGRGLDRRSYIENVRGRGYKFVSKPD